LGINSRGRIELGSGSWSSEDKRRSHLLSISN
jgi:hypothetical protein